MKRLLTISGIYLMVILAIVLPVELYKMFHELDDNKIPGFEARIALRVSRMHTSKAVKRLILGDSTGRLFYPAWQEYDSIVSMACNQAITMAGQYFLLKNYLETNHDNLPDKIVVIYTPFSLSNDVDKYAYQYFLKPFSPSEYETLYTTHLKERIESIPFYRTANWPFIQTSGYTPRFAVPTEEVEVPLSELTYEYLMLIDSLAQVYNIPWEMCSTPVRDDRIQETEKIICALEQKTGALTPVFQSYIQSIRYYPAERFQDATHLRFEDLNSVEEILK